MISLYDVQEMHLFLQPCTDLSDVRHTFSFSAVGRKEFHGAAPHCLLLGASNVSEQPLVQAWPSSAAMSLVKCHTAEKGMAVKY